MNLIHVLTYVKCIGFTGNFSLTLNIYRIDDQRENNACLGTALTGRETTTDGSLVVDLMTSS